MLKAAITGNIGSGKSIVTSIFQSLNIPVFIADREAKKLYELPDVQKEIIDLFGDRIYNAEGVIDKQALANIIFNDKTSLLRLNNIIHPLTLKRYQNWLLDYADHPYTLHESAILFENNLQHHFDKVINIYAPFELRLKRVIERDKLAKSLIIERMQNQMTDDKKNKLADFVIKNDGKSFLIPQVIKIHERLTRQ